MRYTPEDDPDAFEIFPKPLTASAKPRRNTVGHSLRTPSKHTFLRNTVIREASALPHIAGRKVRDMLAGHWWLLDMCAGDGVPTEESGTSSPAILCEAADVFAKSGGHATVLLVEKDRRTYRRLVDNFGHRSNVLVLHGDSRDPDAFPHDWPPNAPMFVFNDPNHAAGFAITDQVAAQLPQYTTTMSTLGCNVGGLMRSTANERGLWHGNVHRVVSHMRRHYDALIVQIPGDSSKWAYLLTGPSVWRRDYVKDAARAFPQIVPAWLRTDPAEFNAICIDLFTTRKEQRDNELGLL